MPSSIPSAKYTTFIIEAADTILIDTGGVPDKLYSFTLTAKSIPVGIGEVTFEWIPGFGAGDSATAQVTDGYATTAIELSYPKPGSYDIISSVYHGQEELSRDSFQVQIAGTTLTIDPPGMTNAQLNVKHPVSFTADDIPIGVNEVKLLIWSFEVGGSSIYGFDIPVTNGTIIRNFIQTYNANGAYGLIAQLRDISTDTFLVQSSATVIAGPTKERKYTLQSCNADWVTGGEDLANELNTSQEGDEGATIDNWNVTAVPHGSVFDVRYNAWSDPEKFLVEYPIGNEVLDIDWHRSSKYNFQSGNTVHRNIFSKLSQDTFRVTPIGESLENANEVVKYEVLKYEVRCRIPVLADNDVCTDDLDCPSAACAYASFSPDCHQVCCVSGTTTILTGWGEGWDYSGYRDFCSDQQEGAPCGEYDELCSSGACVGGICTSSKLAANEVCSDDNDCVGGSCAYGSVNSDALRVCCSSGNRSFVVIWQRKSNGWPSSGYHSFCTNRPDGTQCGSNNHEICSSKSCVGQKCVSD